MVPSFGLKASQTQQSWTQALHHGVRRSRCWPPTSQGHTCRAGSYKKVPAETGWRLTQLGETPAKPMYLTRTYFNWISKNVHSTACLKMPEVWVGLQSRCPKVHRFLLIFSICEELYESHRSMTRYEAVANLSEVFNLISYLISYLSVSRKH